MIITDGKKIKCFFCSDRENLEMAVLILWTVEQVIFICPSCIREMNGRRLDLNFQALLESIEHRFEEKERSPILKQKCLSCPRTLGDLLASGMPSCAGCMDSFSQIILTLINLLEEQRHYIFRPKRADSEIPPEQRAAAAARLRDLDQDPHYKIMHLKERLEALIRDEKFEEALKISEMIKKLRAVPVAANKTS